MNSPKSLNRFMTRYAVREVFKNEKGDMEAAIYLTDKKTLCSDSENYRFYAKISGFLNLQDLNTQKVKEMVQKIDIVGYFLVMTNSRTTIGQRTYALVFPHIETKGLDIPIGSLVSFLPRIDGHTGEVLSGLRIHSSDDTSKRREWTRFVGSAKSQNNGFTELKFGYNYDSDCKLYSKAKYIGFYVTKNCSLLVYDMASTQPEKPVEVAEQNRTLIQEGGFVYADADVLFRVCSDSEDKLYSAKEFYEKYKDSETPILGNDKYKKSHLIRDNKEQKSRSVVCFLKSTQLFPFSLHITEDQSKESLFKGKRVAILTIPSGGQFEYCEFWSLREGLQSVNTRQKAEPWKKYLQKERDPPDIYFDEHLNDVPINSFPPQDKNEKTPQNEELFNKLKKLRKGITSGKVSPPVDSKNDGKPVEDTKKPNESEPKAVPEADKPSEEKKQ